MKLRPIARLVAGLAAAALPAAHAGALLDAYTAAQQYDKELAVARAAHAAAQPRRDQAAALWRPTVGLTAAAGVASSLTEASGAQFSAPGFGSSSGVGFATSVNGAPTVRWALQAAQPLYNPKRRAEQRQLALGADAAELDWQGARQVLVLRTAQRYFDFAQAEEMVRVLQRQEKAVAAAAQEAEDRYTIGSAPITDTHEAKARLAAVRAQLLAARTDAQVKRELLADSTGGAPIAARLPAGELDALAARPLAEWQNDALAGNIELAKLRLAGEVAQQEAAKYARGASTAVDLIAQAGRERVGGSGDFGSAGNTAANRMIGVQVTLPLYSGGWRSAHEQEAQRRIEQSDAELDRARQQVAQQVRAAWLGLQAGAARVQALGEALAASDARLDATRVGHEVGERTTLDLLNAENDLAAARLALAQARVGLWLQRLQLAALAGQLDESLLRTADADLQPPA